MKLAFAFALLALATFAAADDAWIGNGGTPKLMSSHPTIRMVSEVVRLRVEKDHLSADCRFVFHNDGPAVTVKMGFPDESSSREGEDPATSVFKSFRSWVAGKPTPTHLEHGENETAWQVKQVAFPAHGTVRVRDTYVVPPSSGLQSGNYEMSYAAYTLRTGASWKGTIGRADVYVTFGKTWAKPTAVVPYAAYRYKIAKLARSASPNFDSQIGAVLKRNLHAVFWKGPVTPTLHSRTLHFRATNLEPTAKDDIFLAFAPKKYGKQ